jgi:hypothetical protein
VVLLSRLGCLGPGGSCNGAKGPGACCHHMGCWRQKWGGIGSGGRGISSGCGGSVLAGLAGEAHGCWGKRGGFRSDHGGHGHGDGGVDKREAHDAVAGSWWAALGSGVIDVKWTSLNN